MEALPQISPNVYLNNSCSPAEEKSYPKRLGFSEGTAQQSATADIFVKLKDAKPKNFLYGPHPIQEGLTEALLNGLGFVHKYTEYHCRAVADITEQFIKVLGINGELAEDIITGAKLHDIGKATLINAVLPEGPLKKESRLNRSETIIMQTHPELGRRLLSLAGLTGAYNKTVLDTVAQHHEHWDGSGYPKGLAHNEISLAARVVALADTWHAMTDDRPYRKGLPKTEALKRIIHAAGKQFDPELANKFVSFVSKVA